MKNEYKSIGLVSVAGLLLVWLALTKAMSWWLNFSTVVNRIGLGIGAILGGTSAIPIIRDWSNEKNKLRYKDKYMKKFSNFTRDKEKTSIWKSNGNPIYAIDKINRTKQHIRPWSTFKELGYADDGWDKEATPKELEEYDLGEPIDFT
jgi:hypothetical protein